MYTYVHTLSLHDPLPSWRPASARRPGRPRAYTRKTPASGGFLQPGARERTRTSPELPPLATEASASTNSATRAGAGRGCCGARQGLSTPWTPDSEERPGDIRARETGGEGGRERR